MYVDIYIYIYLRECVCVCVCVCAFISFHHKASIELTKQKM